MAFERPEDAAGVEIPDLERPVQRRRDHALAIGSHHTRRHHGQVAYQLAQERRTLSRYRVTHPYECRSLLRRSQSRVDILRAPPHSSQPVPQLRGECTGLVTQPVRLATQGTREIAEVASDRLVSVQETSLCSVSQVRLDVMHAQRAA